MHLVLAANAEADQPWVADATALFARKAGATVAVVSVDEVELERLSPSPRSIFVERAEAAAAGAVERLAAAGVEASSTVLSGGALHRIMEFADAQDADLVVVGASTRPPLASRLLGSVPLALIAASSRPVLVVPNPSHA